MCVIIDANVIGKIFRSESLGEEGNRCEAGKQFFDWLDSNPERLVVGGTKLKKELNSERFKTWLLDVDRRGKFRKYDDKEIDKKAEELRKAKELGKQNAYVSNDAHIIALAQISNARLLYSKDKTLHKDFKNTKLLHDPGGKIFPRGNNRRDRIKRDNILSDESLCRQQ